MTPTVIYAPFSESLKGDLKSMIKVTAFGGENAKSRHYAALSDPNAHPTHLIGAVTHKNDLIGWFSVGASTDASETEAVIRCYLDCIYIAPEHRTEGYASTALSDAAQTLSIIVFKELLHHDNSVTPLDVELSAIHVNDEGEYCVNTFQRAMAHSVSLLSENTNYVYRAFINESTRGT
jgi:hypothetical protein